MDKSVTISIISGFFSLATAMLSLWFKDRLEQRRQRPVPPAAAAAEPPPVAVQVKPPPPPVAAEPPLTAATSPRPDPAEPRPSVAPATSPLPAAPAPVVREFAGPGGRAPARPPAAGAWRRIVASGGVAPLVVIALALLLLQSFLEIDKADRTGFGGFLAAAVTAVLVVPIVLLVMTRRRSRSFVAFALQMATYWSGVLSLGVLPIVTSGSPLSGVGDFALAMLAIWLFWVVVGALVLRPWRRRARRVTG